MTNTDNIGHNAVRDCADTYWERKQSILDDNRAAVFAALDRHGLETVTLTFDGYGDSGQIDDVLAVPEKSLDLSAITLTQKAVRRNNSVIETVCTDLRAALESLCYALLEDVHCGWCNNEGGSGAFVFDTGEGTIRLDFDERYTATETHMYQF